MLFAKVELGMKMASLILLSIISPFGAALGLVVFRILQVRFGWTSKTMVLITLTGMMFIPLWGMLGFTGIVGFIYPVEIFVVTVYYGFFNGVIQSASRTCFCDIIPPGQESEFFGLYEITDKGSRCVERVKSRERVSEASQQLKHYFCFEPQIFLTTLTPPSRSWMGPLICGVLYEITGTMRTAFFYIFGVCATGLVMVYVTDFGEGADACRRKEIQVRMEAVRNKMGVSKIQIQMNAKKFLGVKSGFSSASSVASRASNAGSVAESTAEASSYEAPDNERSRKASILEIDSKDLKHDDVVDETVENLIHRASILETGENVDTHMPTRKSSMFSLNSRTSGSISMHHPSGDRSVREQKSKGSMRKTSMMVIGELTGNDTGAAAIKVAPA